MDLKYPRYAETEGDDFVVGDLRHPEVCRDVVDRRFDEIYQLATHMGGAGFVFTGENDADIMHNSALININMLEACQRRNNKRIFYSSSALHVSRAQPDGSGQSQLRGRLGVSGESGQRVRLGKLVQRALICRVSAQLWF